MRLASRSKETVKDSVSDCNTCVDHGILHKFEPPDGNSPKLLNDFMSRNDAESWQAEYNRMWWSIMRSR
ncbi:hypothetical protein ABBQ32_013139 [Trebouxia sp. C0010 RCD-2024]